MKRTIVSLLLINSLLSVCAQDMKSFKLYKPDEDAAVALEATVKEARKSDKHILVQIGGNWCVWCARFNDFVTTDLALDSAIRRNYAVYHLNYSKENRNYPLLKKYQFPQRFGFPVFLILNGKGELIHTQSSWYLESGKGYDKEKVMAFLNDWSKPALDPAQYKEE